MVEEPNYIIIIPEELLISLTISCLIEINRRKLVSRLFQSEPKNKNE